MKNRCLCSAGSDFYDMFKAGVETLTGYGGLKLPYGYVERKKERMGR